MRKHDNTDKGDAIDFMIAGECSRKEFNGLTRNEQLMIISQFGKDYLGALKFIHKSKATNNGNKTIN